MFRPSRIALAILFVTCAILPYKNSWLAGTELSQERPPGLANSISKPSQLWAREWSAKNLDALMDLYADDAVFLTATGSRTTGKAAIRELFKQALAGSGSQLKVYSRSTEESGNLAYDSGEYDEVSTINGVTKKGAGNYLVVLRRDGNRWRIVQHMWTDAGAKS